MRVTVFGDSVATAMAYDPDAKRTLGRGIDLALEVAACRRVGDASCPYDGVRPPNVIDRATELGRELGPVVVVIAGYNDYEDNYAENIDDAMAVFRKAGVEHVLWATLREQRQSWANMNDTIRAASRKYPEMTVLDWNALAKESPDWLQPDGVHLTPSGRKRHGDHGQRGARAARCGTEARCAQGAEASRHRIARAPGRPPRPRVSREPQGDRRDGALPLGSHRRDARLPASGSPPTVA